MEGRQVYLFLDSNGALDLSVPESLNKQDITKSHRRRSSDLGNMEPDSSDSRSCGLDVSNCVHDCINSESSTMRASEPEENVHSVSDPEELTPSTDSIDTSTETVRDQDLYISALNLDNDDNAKVSDILPVITEFNMCDFEDSHGSYPVKECDNDDTPEDNSNSSHTIVHGSNSSGVFLHGSNSSHTVVHSSTSSVCPDNSHDSSLDGSNSSVSSVHDVSSSVSPAQRDISCDSTANCSDSTVSPEHCSNTSYSPSHECNRTGSVLHDDNSSSGSVLHNRISADSFEQEENSLDTCVHDANLAGTSAQDSNSPDFSVSNFSSSSKHDANSCGSSGQITTSSESLVHDTNSPDTHSFGFPTENANSLRSALDGNSSDIPEHYDNYPDEIHSPHTLVHNFTPSHSPEDDSNSPGSLVRDDKLPASQHHTNSPGALQHDNNSPVSLQHDDTSSSALQQDDNSSGTLQHDDHSSGALKQYDISSSDLQHDDNSSGALQQDDNPSGSPVSQLSSSHDYLVQDDNSSGSSTDCQSNSGYPVYDASFREALGYEHEYSSSTIEDNHNTDSVVSSCSTTDGCDSFRHSIDQYDTPNSRNKDNKSASSPVVSDMCSHVSSVVDCNSLRGEDESSRGTPVTSEDPEYVTRFDGIISQQDIQESDFNNENNGTSSSNGNAAKMVKAKSATKNRKTHKHTFTDNSITFRSKLAKPQSDLLGKSKHILSSNKKLKKTVQSKVNKEDKHAKITSKSRCTAPLNRVTSQGGSRAGSANLLPCVKLTKKLFVEKLGMTSSGSINVCNIPETEMDSDRDSDIDSGVYIPKEVMLSNHNRSKNLETVRKLKTKIKQKSGGNTLNSNERKAVDKALPDLDSTAPKKIYLQPTAKEIHVYNSRKDIGFHCIREQSGEITLKCDSCEYKTDNKYYIWKHIKVHGKPTIRYECNFCDFSCKSAVVYLEHEAKHTLDKPFKCEHCDYCSRNRTDFRRHQDKHLAEKCFKCPECDFVTRWRRNIRHHHRMKHNDERPYHCNICGFTFKRKHDLKGHLYRHNDEKPMQCDQCDFRCKTTYEVKCHKLKHSDVRAFACTVAGCSQRTKTKSDLQKHMNTHNKERKYICLECNKGFTCTGSLSKHKQRHLEVSLWKCDICQKNLRSKTSLRNHIRLHQGIYPHKCDVCGMSFSNKSNLNMHARTHDMKDRPFRCPLCPYGAKIIAQLLSHIGSMHGSQYAYFCEICNKPFKRFGQLQIHMTRMHPSKSTGAKKYKKKSALFELEGLDGSSVQFEQVTIPSSIGTMGECASMSSDMKTDNSHVHEYLAEVDSKQNMELNSNLISPIKDEPVDNIFENIVDKETDENHVRNIDSNIPDLSCQSTSDSFKSVGKHSELEHIPKPIATVVTYNGVSLPLATRGFKFNFQKTGKKPTSWFMQPENMHGDAAEKHIEFLYKKDKGLLPWVGKQRKQKTGAKRGRPPMKVKEQKPRFPGIIPMKGSSSSFNVPRPSTGKRRGRPPKRKTPEASQSVCSNSHLLSSFAGDANSISFETLSESMFLSENNFTVTPHNHDNTICQDGVSTNRISLAPQPVVWLERIPEGDFSIKTEEVPLDVCSKRLSSSVKKSHSPKKKRRVQDTTVKQQTCLKKKITQKKNKKGRACKSGIKTTCDSYPAMASNLTDNLHETVARVKAPIFPRLRASVKVAQRKVKKLPLKSATDVPVDNHVQPVISKYSAPLDDKQRELGKAKHKRKRKATSSYKSKVSKDSGSMSVKSMSDSTNVLGSSVINTQLDGATAQEQSLAECAKSLGLVPSKSGSSDLNSPRLGPVKRRGRPPKRKPVEINQAGCSSFSVLSSMQASGTTACDETLAESRLEDNGTMASHNQGNTMCQDVFSSEDALPRYAIAKPKTDKAGNGIKLRIVLKKHSAKGKAKARQNNVAKGKAKTKQNNIAKGKANARQNNVAKGKAKARKNNVHVTIDKKKKGKVSKRSASNGCDDIPENIKIIHSKTKVKVIASKQTTTKNRKMKVKPSQKTTKRAPVKKSNGKKIVEGLPSIEDSDAIPNPIEQTMIKLESVFEEELILGDQIVPASVPAVTLGSCSQTESIACHNQLIPIDSVSAFREGPGLVISNVTSQLYGEPSLDITKTTHQEQGVTNSNADLDDTTVGSIPTEEPLDSDDAPLDLRITHDRLDRASSGMADGSLQQVLFKDQGVVVEPVNVSMPIFIKMEPPDEEII